MARFLFKEQNQSWLLQADESLFVWDAPEDGAIVFFEVADLAATVDVGDANLA